jgi:hypothetical protein
MMQSNPMKIELASTTAKAALAAYDTACAEGGFDRDLASAAHMLAAVLRKPKAAKPAPDDGIKALKAALDRICSVVPTRNSIPILECVRLTLQGGRLRLIGTDLDAETVVTVDGVQGADFDVCVSATRLRDLIRVWW